MMPTKHSQSWLPSIFNDFFGNEWVERTAKTAPAVNIIENEHDYRVEFAAPGLTKEDVDIQLTDDNELTITLQKHEEQEQSEKKGRYLRREFSYNQFQQRMILPENIDKEKIQAKVKHGVLTLEIPKRSEEAVAKSTRKVTVY